METPYRTPGTVEKEPEVMTNEQMFVTIWKYAITGLVLAVSVISICCHLSSVHKDNADLQMRMLDNTDNVKQTIQARAVEAKAQADKAMFDSMKRP